MSTHRPHPRILPLTLLWLTLLSGLARADYFTVTVTNAGSASFAVPSNTFATVISMYAWSNATLSLTINGYTSTERVTSPGFFINGFALSPQIIGPATFTITNTLAPNTNFLSYITVQTSPAATPIPPSGSVVIPNDANGPVTIALESSTDLLNWAPALPGIYPTTDPHRFFRVRAVR